MTINLGWLYFLFLIAALAYHGSEFGKVYAIV